MRVLQLIDSLHAGGAERIAVNYANSLQQHIEGSFLCVTREEGLLKESIGKGVQYLFLSKKSTFDYKAIHNFNTYIKNNNIDIIHAHASSFFFGSIIKILNPNVALIWHEHYGNRDKTSLFSQFVLNICSHLFSSIITVNDSLKIRSETKLHSKKVHTLPNYSVEGSTMKTTRLHGKINKRIICLANLREEKDHLNLLSAYVFLKREYSEWTLHLVGAYNNDNYYSSISKFIIHNGLIDDVYIYGSCSDVFHILSQCNIGVLASKSEGLPLALLEYGLAKLPVVATKVGDCEKVISTLDEGILVVPENSVELANALKLLINDINLRASMAENLNKKVISNYSEMAVMESLLKIYKNT